MAESSTSGDDRGLRLERACAELARRLHAGEDVRSETLLAPWPEAADDPELAIELIYTEFTAREELGQQPRPESFLKRFPQYADALARQFEIHALLAAADEPTGNTPVVDRRQEAALAGQAEDTPTEIGGYRILGEIGRGAMGVIYKATHRDLGRIVALKRLPGGQGAGVDSLKRFGDEARIMAALRHPNIVQIDEVGEDAAGCPFMACEFVDGGTLAYELAAGLIGVDRAVRLVRTLAEAVDCAHRLGILHCDLSPANILLAHDGSPKIADFGLARLRRDSLTANHAGVLAGTPAYMAPEQLAEPERIGPATDVYALGAILYELLTGRPPLAGATPWETLQQVAARRPPPLRHLRPHLSRNLEAICNKCLAKEVSGRYPSARQLAADLEHFLAGEPVSARPIGVPERLARAAARRPVAAAAIGIAALAISTLIVGGARYNTLLRVALTRTENQQAQIQEQATELAARLAVSRRSIFAMQLNQAEMVLEQAPSQAVELLSDDRRCPADLRDFAWGMLYHRSAQDRATLRGASRGILALAMPTSNRAIALGRGGELVQWRIDTAQVDVRRRLPASDITALAVTTDQTIAVASEDYLIHVGDFARTDQSQVLRGHRARITALAFSVDEANLVSGSADGEVRLWSVAQQKSSIVQPACGVAVREVAISAAGDRLSAGSADGTVRVWQLGNGQLDAEFGGHSGGVFGLSFSPDSKTLLAGGLWNGRVDVWDLTTKKIHGSLSVNGSLLRTLAQSPDGTLVAAAATDQTIRLWDLKSLSEHATFRGHALQVDCLAFSRDGKTLLSADENGTVKLWDVQQRPVPLEITGAGGRLLALDFSRNGQTLAGAGFDPVVRLWDVATGQQRMALAGHEAAVRAVRFSAAGDRLASAGEDGAVRLWDLHRKAAIAVWQHPCWATDVSFSPDGQTVATAATDGIVRLWSVGQPDGEPLAKLGETGPPINAVCFSGDGQLLAAASRDKTVELWDPLARRRLVSLRGHDGSVMAVAFSRDGRWLASGGEDMEVKLWDVGRREPVAVWRGHTRPINSLAFSADGRTLASGTGNRWLNESGEVRLWDVESGNLHATLHEQDGPVAFADDDRALATCRDATIAVWEAAVYRSLDAIRATAEK